MYTRFCLRSGSPPAGPPGSFCCCRTQESASFHPWKHRPLQTSRARDAPMYLRRGWNLWNNKATCVWIYFGAGLQLCRSLAWTLLLAGTVQRASAGFPRYPLCPPHTHACQPEKPDRKRMAGLQGDDGNYLHVSNPNRYRFITIN